MARIASLRDVPIDGANQESLGLKPYAAALADFVKNCDTPITIGIQGDWGIGKTSLLQLIVELLGPVRGQSRRFHTIRVETWQYAQFSQEEYIAISVLSAINSAILGKLSDADRAKIETKVSGALKNIWSVALHVSSQAIKNKTGLDINEGIAFAEKEAGVESVLFHDLTKEVVKFKEVFRDLVNKLVPSEADGRLIIIIDDLDRIKPVRALELLEAIKNFLDVPKCVFILSVDYSVIEKGVEQKMGSLAKSYYGRAFFDKIIQVPFNMPVASYKIDRYIMSLLGMTYDEADRRYIPDTEKGEPFFKGTGIQSLDELTADFFTNITRLTTGNNPRAIKRTVNYANLLKLIKINNPKAESKRWKVAEAQVIYALANLQLAWPEIFNYFLTHPSPDTLQRLHDMNFIDSLPEAKPLLERAEDPIAVRSQITGFIDELINLIDANGDNEISANEFDLVWRVIQDTNLTSVRLESLENNWDEIKQRAVDNSAKGATDDIESVMTMFKSSLWNDRLSLQLVSAGKKAHNMLWNTLYVGSIVSTKKELIQFYLNDKDLSLEALQGALSETLRKYVVRTSGAHYGIGNIKVLVSDIVKDEPDPNKHVAIINELLAKAKPLFISANERRK